MFLQRFIGHQLLHGRELFSQRHLIIVIVNPAMAEAANINASIEFSLGKVLSKIGPSMHLFGQQMMKREGCFPPTKGTFPLLQPFRATAFVGAIHTDFATRYPMILTSLLFPGP